MTFSIVAWDPNATPSPEWGIAVASKFLAVGAVVPWARAGAGAVATQAFANLAYGREGLERLARGEAADDVVRALTEADDGRADRQVGVVDRDGGAATFTGADCFEWAGGRTGEGYCCQGNILAGEGVVDAMAEAFESASHGLPQRLLTALAAGDDAGGDRRGRQSAALLVVREGAGYAGGNDVALDLRVDDHVAPVPELVRLLDLHGLYFPRKEELEFIPIDAVLAAEIRDLLAAAGYSPPPGEGYDDALKDELRAFTGTENLEERWTEDAAIEERVLAHLRARRAG